MRRGGFLARRSAAEWGTRAALALAVAILGCFGVAQSVALLTRSNQPDLAYRLTPYDGRATGALAEQMFIQGGDAKTRNRAVALARHALRQDPTAIAAVVTLGLRAQLGGDMARARTLFAYAESLSRRDLQTQLWQIEDAVARGDIAVALQHYDIALRTSKKAPDLLFPVLATAIAEPAIRVNLARTLAKGPAWGPSFIDYAAGKGTDRPSVVRLFVTLKRKGVGVSPEATAGVINGLIAAGAFDDAWRYYATVHPDADRSRSRNPRFGADPTTPSVFDWTPVNDANVSTSIQRGSVGGVFDFAVPSSGGGALLRQMQLLPAGTYRLEGHGEGIDQPQQSLPYWVLTCQDGRELGRVVVPNSAQAAGSFAGRLSVPPNCPVQTLTLMARPSDRVSGVAGQIDQVRLTPAG